MGVEIAQQWEVSTIETHVSQEDSSFEVLVGAAEPLVNGASHEGYLSS